MSDNPTPKTCWVVSDGRAGIENQALGLAEAVARQVPLDIAVKRISVGWPWRYLPQGLWGARPFGKLSAVTDASGELDPQGLDEPWPDLWIACGRLSIPFSVAVHETRGSYVVQAQDPRRPLDGFDLVVPPYHDGVSGANVIPIHGAPTRLTPERLAQDAARLAAALPDLPTPRIAVIIGGDSKAFRMTPAVLETIAGTIEQLADGGAGIMITTSRRTGADNRQALHDRLAGRPGVVFCDEGPMGGLDNPYAGLLGLADHILVTQESTNMITEAALTGRPVHILPMERGNSKFRNFHNTLHKKGITRPLSLPLEEWRYDPLAETDRAARQIVKRWLGRGLEIETVTDTGS